MEVLTIGSRTEIFVLVAIYFFATWRGFNGFDHALAALLYACICIGQCIILYSTIAYIYKWEKKRVKQNAGAFAFLDITHE